MYTVLVELHVKESHLDEFIEGLRVNARATLLDEPGCLRFDVHRSLEDPCRFVLHEIYVDAAAFEIAHRQAPHYATWREVSQRCVREGGHVNTYLAPLFPADIAEGHDPS